MRSVIRSAAIVALLGAELTAEMEHYRRAEAARSSGRRMAGTVGAAEAHGT